MKKENQYIRVILGMDASFIDELENKASLDAMLINTVAYPIWIILDPEEERPILDYVHVWVDCSVKKSDLFGAASSASLGNVWTSWTIRDVKFEKVPTVSL